ncbi:DUF4180 domain-containing protein [Nocardia sp. 348MFTsu5.1]|uniref:DUF4180 domain-containing protein n=1 Tax=Nocardia sp. 348MFTsu5.1 TaxID=1172185 RepID=UPI00036AE798|nr:DUF4180 domain-containing protein [Nocardia sp. 348MFTsu5.1]
MTTFQQTSNGEELMVYGETGESIAALDAVGATWGRRVAAVIIPLTRLPDGFLDLRTGVAGEYLQKMVTYQIVIAIIGDISIEIARSESLAAFVRESNRGRHVWFIESIDDVHARIG